MPVIKYEESALHCVKPLEGKLCCGLRENGVCAFSQIQCPYLSFKS